MNWFFNFSLIPTLFIVLALVLIYRTRTKSEEYLGLKIVGYYLLGSFSINVVIVIPVGIIAYFLFFRPNANFRTKRYAAVFGFIMMVLSHLFPSF